MNGIIVFDYDGTLHKTMDVYKPAIASAIHLLQETYAIDVAMPDDARIESWLGITTADMWKDFLPDLEESIQAHVSAHIGDVMQELVFQGKSAWFEGVEDTLDALVAQGYELVVLSNCSHRYAAYHWEAFDMQRWFSAFFACETWNAAPKYEIMKDILADFDAALAKSPTKKTAHFSSLDNKEISVNQMMRAMIGDRESDLLAASAVGIPFVGCLYGYSNMDELQGSTIFVNNSSHLLQAITDVIEKDV